MGTEIKPPNTEIKLIIPRSHLIRKIMLLREREAYFKKLGVSPVVIYKLNGERKAYLDLLQESNSLSDVIRVDVLPIVRFNIHKIKRDLKVYFIKFKGVIKKLFTFKKKDDGWGNTPKLTIKEILQSLI